MLSRAALASYRRPTAWMPVVAVALLALLVAEVLEPWPEGGVLLTLPGDGSHGITTSDVVLLVVLVVAGVAWLRYVWVRDRVRSLVG